MGASLDTKLMREFAPSHPLTPAQARAQAPRAGRHAGARVPRSPTDCHRGKPEEGKHLWTTREGCGTAHAGVSRVGFGTPGSRDKPDIGFPPMDSWTSETHASGHALNTSQPGRLGQTRTRVFTDGKPGWLGYDATQPGQLAMPTPDPGLASRPSRVGRPDSLTIRMIIILYRPDCPPRCMVIRASRWMIRDGASRRRDIRDGV